jgi:hypothetical protein
MPCAVFQRFNPGAVFARCLVQVRFLNESGIQVQVQVFDVISYRCVISYRRVISYRGCVNCVSSAAAFLFCCSVAAWGHRDAYKFGGRWSPPFEGQWVQKHTEETVCASHF